LKPILISALHLRIKALRWSDPDLGIRNLYLFADTLKKLLGSGKLEYKELVAA